MFVHLLFFFLKKKHSVSHQQILMGFPAGLLRQPLLLKAKRRGWHCPSSWASPCQQGCFSLTLTEPSSIPKYTTWAMSMNSPVSTTPAQREVAVTAPALLCFCFTVCSARVHGSVQMIPANPACQSPLVPFPLWKSPKNSMSH